MQAETTIKLGEIACLEMGQSPDSRFVHEEEKGVPFLQGNAEFGGLFPSARLYCSAPTKMCRRGDVLISVRAPVGALNKADQDYCIGRGLAAVRFNEVLPEFGWHVLNHWASNLRVVAQGTTFEAVGKAELWQLDIGPSFSLLEQRRIAEILDTADEAIAQTEALIAKLRQMKAGLLHDLLTRGLDENGQLRDPIAHPEQFKDSSLGRMPREWKVGRLRDFYLIPARNGLYKSVNYYGRGSLMIHMPQMFRGLTIDISDAVRLDLNASTARRKYPDGLSC